MASTPCVQDHGIYSQIPDSAVSMKSFVSAYHRLGGDLEVLQNAFTLEPWQLYAAMAFYCANKEMFDAETARFREQQRTLTGIPVNSSLNNGNRGFPTGEEATDEEMDAWLEELS